MNAPTRPTPLHLVKLCVGPESIGDLEARIAAQLTQKRAAGEECAHFCRTRMVPKQAGALVRGGSLYWVIRGFVSARQSILEVRPVTDADGIGRCLIRLEPAVRPVAPRPHRAFQGWRYLKHEERPPDLDDRAPGALDMPEAMRRELGELGLL